jgi:hypothetical protein
MKAISNTQLKTAKTIILDSKNRKVAAMLKPEEIEEALWGIATNVEKLHVELINMANLRMKLGKL